MKRMVTLQDISCIGRCSLTAALPIISAMGTETAVIPTALLSTHTAFEGFTFLDLTEQIEKISAHWKALGLDFSCIYTGYLGSARQLETVSRFIDDFGGGALVVDPVMGDFGRLYSGFDAAFAAEMSRLCARADIIVPNLTEACLLLGEEYREDMTPPETREILRRLCGMGAKTAVLTGVKPRNDKIGVMAYDSAKNEFFEYYGEKIDAVFHGTGDIFASVLAGGLCRGMSANESMSLAVDFTAQCIKMTTEDPEHRWYGVNFEAALPWLTERCR